MAEQVANGILTPDEARRHPFRNVITQALGNGGDLDVQSRKSRSRNWIVFCYALMDCQE